MLHRYGALGAANREWRGLRDQHAQPRACNGVIPAGRQPLEEAITELGLAVLDCVALVDDVADTHVAQQKLEREQAVHEALIQFRSTVQNLDPPAPELVNDLGAATHLHRMQDQMIERRIEVDGELRAVLQAGRIDNSGHVPLVLRPAILNSYLPIRQKVRGPARRIRGGTPLVTAGIGWTQWGGGDKSY